MPIFILTNMIVLIAPSPHMFKGPTKQRLCPQNQANVTIPILFELTCNASECSWYICIVLMAGTHLLSILYNILQKFAQFL